MNLYDLLREIISRGILFNLAHLLVVIATFMIGVLVYKSNPRNLNNRSFMLLNIAFAVWSFMMYVSDFTFLPHYVVLGTGRLTWGLGYVLAFVFFNFCLTFPEQNRKKPWYWWLSLVVVSVMTLLAATTGLVQKNYSISKVNQFDYIISSGPLFAFTFFCYAFLAFGGVWLLFAKFKSLKGRKRVQVKYVFLGAFVFILYIFATDLIPILLDVSDLSRYGAVGVILFVGFTAYAVIKHRLMDIRFLVLRSVTYSATVGLIIGIYAFIIYFATSKFVSLNVNSGLINIFMIVVGLALYNPLRRIIENKTDKLFFKGRYSFQELMAEISDIITKNSRNIKSLTSEIINLLTKAMKINKAAFVLLSNPSKGRIETLGFKSKPEIALVDFIDLANRCDKALVLEELEEDKKEKAILKKAQTEVLIPIKTEERCEAILALGQKKSGDMYSSQDLKLLELAAPQIAIALENARLYEQAITDALTGLYHHKYFHLRLKEEFERSKRYKYPLSLIMLDLDFFKEVNDKWGHQIGDEVLIELTSLIKENVRSYDIVGRYGGDEFVILLPVVSKKEEGNHQAIVKKITNRLRKVIEKHSFTSMNLRIQASLGIAIYNGKTDACPEELTEKADKLLYKAKNSGRNTVCIESLKSKRVA